MYINHFYSNENSENSKQKVNKIFSQNQHINMKFGTTFFKQAKRIRCKEQCSNAKQIFLHECQKLMVS